MKTPVYKISILKSLLVILTLAIASPIFAQHNGGGANMEQRKEKLKVLKVSYLTTQMALTTDEAEKFWPVYNEYQDKLMELHVQKIQLHRSAKAGFETFTDAEIDNFLNQSLLFKQQELDIEKLYLERIKKVLPIRKVALLQKAEKDFRTEVMREYQNRKGEGQKPNNGGKP